MQQHLLILCHYLHSTARNMIKKTFGRRRKRMMHFRFPPPTTFLFLFEILTKTNQCIIAFHVRLSGHFPLNRTSKMDLQNLFVGFILAFSHGSNSIFRDIYWIFQKAQALLAHHTWSWKTLFFAPISQDDSDKLPELALLPAKMWHIATTFMIQGIPLFQ